jgi:hypothetical protein
MAGFYSGEVYPLRLKGTVVVHLAFFITTHGYGHGVRACAVANAFPSNISLTFRTMLPYGFFARELHRPFTYLEGEFDCGCVQHDGVTVDISATLERYRMLAGRNRQVLGREVRWCREEGIDGIISDITPFAFEIAQAAGLPSVAVTNFTWYDIYAQYLASYPVFSGMVDRIREQYSSAGLLCAVYPPLPMEYFSERMLLPVVARTGKDIRTALMQRLGLRNGTSLGLIYMGGYGMDSMEWKKLECYRDWEFAGVYPLRGNPSNYHCIKEKDFRYQDLPASVDLVIGKLGYGIFSECVINGVPLLFLPRDNFAEYPVLERSALEWGGGYKLSHEEFCSMRWEKSLDAIVASAAPPAFPSDGAYRCALEIERYIWGKMKGQG